MKAIATGTLLFALCMHLPGFGQSLERQAISPLSISTTTFSSTLGELSINTFTSSIIVLTQGFEQGDIIEEPTLGSLYTDVSSHLFAYPNPASSELTISANLQETETYYLDIFDLNGMKVQPTKTVFTNGPIEKISLKEISSGQYVLRIYSEVSSNHGVLKILKISND